MGIGRTSKLDIRNAQAGGAANVVDFQVAARQAENSTRPAAVGILSADRAGIDDPPVFYLRGHRLMRVAEDDHVRLRRSRPMTGNPLKDILAAVREQVIVEAPGRA